MANCKQTLTHPGCFPPASVLYFLEAAIPFNCKHTCVDPRNRRRNRMEMTPVNQLLSVLCHCCPWGLTVTTPLIPCLKMVNIPMYTKSRGFYFFYICKSSEMVYCEHSKRGTQFREVIVTHMVTYPTSHFFFSKSPIKIFFLLPKSTVPLNSTAKLAFWPIAQVLHLSLSGPSLVVFFFFF